jgi:dihydroflavonol-4-reductase
MILVTGGTGLLGSHLLYRLVQEHAEVIALKRPSSNLEEVRKVFGYYPPGETAADALFERIRWVDANLLNQVDVLEAMQGIGRVYHCAGIVSFQPRDRKKMLRFNAGSTACVVQACLAEGVDKLLHVSSTSTIGRSTDKSPATENLIWAKTKSSSAYSESKFRAEMEVWRGMEEGLNAVIVNPSIIFGPGFWERGSTSMFSRVAGGLRYATPGITGYVGVQDVVRAMTGLMDSELSGERYIVSEGNYSFREIFSMISESMGITRKIKPVSRGLLQSVARLDALASVFRGKRAITSQNVHDAFNVTHFSSGKIREALGMEFTPLKQVLEEMALHYLKEHPKK